MRPYGFSRRDETEEKWVRVGSCKRGVNRFYKDLLSRKGRKSARRQAKKEIG